MSQWSDRGFGSIESENSGEVKIGLRYKAKSPVSPMKGENYAKNENTPRSCKTLQSDSFRQNLETFCRDKTLVATQVCQQKKKTVRYDRSF